MREELGSYKTASRESFSDVGNSVDDRSFAWSRKVD